MLINVGEVQIFEYKGKEFTVSSLSGSYSVMYQDKVVKKYSKIKYDYALTIPDKNEANTFIVETATSYKLFKLFTCVNCFGTWICIGLVIWAVLFRRMRF